MTTKIDLNSAPTTIGSGYPGEFAAPCAARERRRLGDAAGLTQFGVNVTRLPPGTWSSQRHWHSAEDEFVYILQGTVVLVSDSGEQTLNAGDCAGFKAGVADGHQLRNDGDQDVVILEIGSRRRGEDAVVYPDIDLQILKGARGFSHRNGEPYR